MKIYFVGIMVVGYKRYINDFDISNYLESYFYLMKNSNENINKFFNDVKKERNYAKNQQDRIVGKPAKTYVRDGFKF